MVLRFKKAEINKVSKTIQNQLKKNNTLPSNISMVDMDKGAKRWLNKSEYAYIFEARNLFAIKHGREPNYVSLVATANNPLVMDYQDGAMTCCCASVAMAVQMLYGYVSEKTVCSKLGTSKKDGTSPSKLLDNAPKLGLKVKIIPRNKESVKNCLKLNMPVIAHIDTEKAKCLGYKKNYGHYVLIYGVSGDYYKIADPTKSLKECKCSMLDNAMKGRKINYYSVSLL